MAHTFALDPFDVNPGRANRTFGITCQVAAPGYPLREGLNATLPSESRGVTVGGYTREKEQSPARLENVEDFVQRAGRIVYRTEHERADHRVK